ncbi:Probable oxygen-independent coproporphyrinogen III oxidase HemN [Mycobacteroides abscessus subsp. abscessus]|nr:Probable oxygen-independent coproporphyrinogen III oxidase HemN [Mycobacteroides abscessus subsp. abscessus]
MFVGGGTPSLLGGSGLAEVLDAIGAHFVLAPGAEVTTEANPESTSPAFFDTIRAAGYTRVSLGMQSAAPHVLATLDRVHAPGRAVAAAREARAAGLGHVNLDLIYGTPGETDDDLRRSVAAVLEAGVDHVSAYALVVEEGTALARRVRRGELPNPDEDALADRYQLLDAALTEAGLDWYEVSNWARPGGQCRHNLGYWAGGDWWGAGPGAHGHVNGVRWWNVKHPNTYARQLGEGQLPVGGHEILSPVERHTEEVLLAVRLNTGIALTDLTIEERDRVPAVVDRGLGRLVDERLVLTDQGRLLADGVVRAILD